MVRSHPSFSGPEKHGPRRVRVRSGEVATGDLERPCASRVSQAKGAGPAWSALEHRHKASRKREPTTRGSVRSRRETVAGTLSHGTWRGFCGLLTLWLLAATETCDTLSLGFAGSKPRHITEPLCDIDAETRHSAVALIIVFHVGAEENPLYDNAMITQRGERYTALYRYTSTNSLKTPSISG